NCNIRLGRNALSNANNPSHDPLSRERIEVRSICRLKRGQLTQRWVRQVANAAKQNIDQTGAFHIAVRTLGQFTVYEANAEDSFPCVCSKKSIFSDLSYKARQFQRSHHPPLLQADAYVSLAPCLLPNPCSILSCVRKESHEGGHTSISALTLEHGS